MNIKAEVFKKIGDNIQKQFNDVEHKIRENKFQFKKLTEEQTILKRMKSELTEIYNYTVKRRAIEEK